VLPRDHRGRGETGEEEGWLVPSPGCRTGNTTVVETRPGHGHRKIWAAEPTPMHPNTEAALAAVGGHGAQ